jgi:NAD(P)-dependent dehydrogenase (short-subunit alcohol dehydrogenase family)
MKNKKLVIVTGGSRGIGLNIVKKLLSQKFKVICIARNTNTVIIKNLKNKYKTSFSHFDCNIANPKEVKNLFLNQISKMGNLYALINNAGINPSRNILNKTSILDWQATINTNINGTFYCTKYTIEQMLKNKKKGIIIMISSIAGLVSMEKRASYATTKGALVSLTKSIATDYAKKNIRSFCICPAYIETELTKPYLDSLSSNEYRKLLELHKLNNLGKPNDISHMVSFLLDDETNWMTGNIIPVDGGYVV